MIVRIKILFFIIAHPIKYKKIKKFKKYIY